ncbi:hypothetical protein IP83_12570 [Novosphingobium sp. AAP93]|nr:hypothetical protein IP83_12570 [Novosphingobium sp. AAP93]
MRTGLPGFDGEHRVEEKDSSLCPVLQMAMVWARQAEIRLLLLEDVEQAWRHGHAGPDRKGKAMCLARAMVWILPKYHDTDLWQRCQRKRSKACSGWGIDQLASSLLGAQKSAQSPQRLACQHALQRRTPSFGNGAACHQPAALAFHRRAGNTVCIGHTRIANGLLTASRTHS